MNIEESYVSFEVAKLLKEKGFDEACWSWYHNGNNTHTGTSRYRNSELEKYDFSKATLAHAMKWLREVHSAIIIIDTNDRWLGEDNRFYWYKIYYKMGSRIEKKWYFDPSKPTDILRYQTYEEACEAAIKDCLKNLL